MYLSTSIPASAGRIQILVVVPVNDVDLHLRSCFWRVAKSLKECLE